MTKMEERYGTIEWAATLMGVSCRTVLRMINAGRLTALTPLTAPRESARHKRMLVASEVREMRDARLKVTGRG